MPRSTVAAPISDDVEYRRRMDKKWEILFKAANKPGALIGQKYI